MKGSPCKVIQVKDRKEAMIYLGNWEWLKMIGVMADGQEVNNKSLSFAWWLSYFLRAAITNTMHWLAYKQLYFSQF